MFLGLDEKEIGQIGGGKRKPNGRLDVAMIQSLVRQGRVEDLVETYGHVIVDECHHVPAVSFERVLSEVKAGIQGIYAALAADEARNRLILDDVLHALEEGRRSPILLTERGPPRVLRGAAAWVRASPGGPSGGA